ncbi:MAG: metal ABC transporter ATP-binding protein [Acidimicrobiales bacterium]
MTDDRAGGGEPVIELVGADIGYEGRTVIEDLDLRIDAGEAVAILGANGSGKSTLIRGVLGLAAVQRGSVRVFGVDRRRFDQWRRIGYVPQRQTVGGAIPSTVTEVVSSGRLTQVRPWRRLGPADRQAVAEAIEAVGLTDRFRASMATLSGGQQRRVLIARALATGPDVLVLDEPTAGVDRANQEALAASLVALAERGVTIVLVTHELGPVAPLVTRTIVMREGAIVHDGSRVDLGHEGHDDDWHHDHGEPPPTRPGMGLLR